MPYGVSIVLGIIFAVALTVLAYIFIMPAKRANRTRNAFVKFIHNYFQFKKLYLEEVLKALFTLATIACITCGTLLLISVERYYNYSYYSGGYYTNRSTFVEGLCVLVLGPIVLRLLYEGIMMFVLLVKNTIEINNKMPAPAAAPAEEKFEKPAKPVAPVAPAYEVSEETIVAPIAQTAYEVSEETVAIPQNNEQ